MTAIPDPNFEQALIDIGFDDVLDTQVDSEVIGSVLTLHLLDLGIQDLTGIEDFTSLTSLNVGMNNLQEIDLSYNTNLEILWCYYNNLSTLNIENLTNLMRLECQHNQLTELDVSACGVLQTLDCSENKLESLLLPNTSELIIVQCAGNELDALDVTNVPTLQKLELSDNLFTEIDVSNNQFLNWFLCDSNSFSSIDVSQNPYLETFHIGYQNTMNSIDLSQNPLLRWFSCGNSAITSLDLSSNWGLQFFYCDSTKLLTCLNLQNGAGQNLIGFNAIDTPELTCIQVDNSNYFATAWESYVDNVQMFSENCASDCTVGISSLQNTPKKCIKIIDYMGRETSFKPNMPLIYVYDDGSKEKVFSVE
ncbi:MAG: hypothetical protein CBB76_10385 [Crocinitomicaceae bacterium TMED16]|nr:MAG: hypothetical protein CBB76_10385 [Crocinitomicaceae bacterium TMED16]